MRNSRNIIKSSTTYDVSVRPWGGMTVERLKDLGFKDANSNSYDNVAFTYTTDEEPSKAYKKLRKIIEDENELGAIVMFEKQIIKSGSPYVLGNCSFCGTKGTDTIENFLRKYGFEDIEYSCDILDVDPNEEVCEDCFKSWLPELNDKTYSEYDDLGTDTRTGEPFVYNSRRISSSQKGYENVVEGTPYDDYHIDTTGMGILDVEHIINEIEGRGNQAVLTVQTSDGRVSHTQFNAKDWKEYKDAVNGVDEFSRNSGTKGAAITDVWVTEVKGGSYVRNSRKAIKSEVVWENENYLISTTGFDDKYYVDDKLRPWKAFQFFYNLDDAIAYAQSNPNEGDDIFPDERDVIDIYNSRKPVKSARFLVEDENGEVIAEADTYEEAQTMNGAMIIDTQNEQEEGGLFQSNRAIKSAKTVTYEGIPEYAVNYLCYHDSTGLTDEDIENIEEWQRKEGVGELASVEDEYTYFRDHPEFGLATTCVTGTFWVNSSKKNETTKQTITRILSSIVSGEMTEDEAAEEIAQNNNCNIGYAKTILSYYMEDKDRYLTSGMLELGESLNVEFDPDGNLDSWSVDFATDPEKPAPTLGGELVRAARYIISAFRDSGEKIGIGYAREILNPAARFIIDNTDYNGNNVIQDFLNGEVYDDERYEDWINDFETDFADYLRDHSEFFEKLNKEDFTQNTEESDEYGSIDYFSVNNEHFDYWFEYENGQYVCDYVDNGSDPEFQEGDIVTADEYPFDEINFDEEYGSFTDDDGFTYWWEDGDGESVRISDVEINGGEFEEGDILTPEELQNLADKGYKFHDRNGNEIKITEIL